MENFQDGGLVADFRLSVLIDWKCRFWLSESAFRKSTSDDKCLEGVVLWSIAVNFYLFSAMNSCQRGVNSRGSGFHSCPQGQNQSCL